MATIQRPTSGRQNRWGMCTNPQCPNYRQKIEITHGDFVCPEEGCKRPLSPCAPPKANKSFIEKNKKPIAIISGVVLGIAAIGGGIYALTGKTGGEGKTNAKVTLNHTQKTLKVGESDTLKATVTPEGSQATYVWRASKKSNAIEVSSDGIVTAKEEGESKVQVQAIIDGDTVSSICAYKVEKADVISTKEHKDKTKDKTKDKDKDKTNEPKPINNVYGTVNLGYGTYTGDLKNGKPHGHGTITYKKSRRIVSWSDEMASPGDKFEGDFRDGVINGLGYLKTRDGNVIAIQ